ncbi:tyrosine-type recombinase/integrase [bacterium]|nr:tyrosine-type recombinase/integrase [bacterium]
MDKILLSELIKRTKNAVRPFEHSQSTSYQYQMAWKDISSYFLEHHQVLYSKQLAEQYLLELREKWRAGTIKRWRYQLYRRTAQILVEYDETGGVTWKKYKDDPPVCLHHAAYKYLHQEYCDFLKKEGKRPGTIQTYEIVGRQFLEYLEEKNLDELTEVRGNDVSAFIPFIAQRYQPESMRTVLSALRSFIGFVEHRNVIEISLSQAIPSSSGRITKVFPTLAPDDVQKLLDAVDCTTPVGKRNYAMLLLAIRTGLRSIDITNLKLSDVHWESNTIEIVQAKTGAPLVLPLLADVGNAIADYILNARPASEQPYIFLRVQAPYLKLSSHSGCYGISCKVMKAAGIRQGAGERKGFHEFRHYLAMRLLLEETPLPIISSILGHRDKESTKIYLSIDLVHLRTCALGLKGIEVTKEELL